MIFDAKFHYQVALAPILRFWSNLLWGSVLPCQFQWYPHKWPRINSYGSNKSLKKTSLLSDLVQKKYSIPEVLLTPKLWALLDVACQWPLFWQPGKWNVYIFGCFMTVLGNGDIAANMDTDAEAKANTGSIYQM